MRKSKLAILIASITTCFTLTATAQNTGPVPASLQEHVSDDPKVVWGGGSKESSSYSGKIVPVTIDVLAAQRLAGYKWGGPSQGSMMNAMKVTVNPTHLALCQGDICSTLNGKQIPGTSWNYRFRVVQKDVADECLYMATKSPHYQTWGHILENAWDLQIATDGELSGSYGTLKNVLMGRYPDLQDAQVVSVKDVDGNGKANSSDIIHSVIKGHTNFGFVTMRPDPDNEVFKLINENGIHLVPVIDFDLEDIYTFKNLKVSNSTMLGFGEKAKYHETACTQVQLITGDPTALTAEQSRLKRRLEATIKRTSAVDSHDYKQQVISQFTSWKDYLDSVRDISGERLTELLNASKAKIDELAVQAVK